MTLFSRKIWILERTLKFILFQLEGTSSTSPGGSKPHPAWPFTPLALVDRTLLTAHLGSTNSSMPCTGICDQAPQNWKSAMRKGPRHLPERNLENGVQKSQPSYLWLGMAVETNPQGCPSFQLVLWSRVLHTTGAQLWACSWSDRTHGSPSSVSWAKMCKCFPEPGCRSNIPTRDGCSCLKRSQLPQQLQESRLHDGAALCMPQVLSQDIFQVFVHTVWAKKQKESEWFGSGEMLKIN